MGAHPRCVEWFWRGRRPRVGFPRVEYLSVSIWIGRRPCRMWIGLLTRFEHLDVKLPFLMPMRLIPINVMRFSKLCDRRIRNPSKPVFVRVLLHSLAFGTLKPFIADSQAEAVSKSQIDMTLDVMANSLVYWSQDLVARKLMGHGSRIFSMTSAGGARVWRTYGAVSAAKSALESHTRQLALELAPTGYYREFHYGWGHRYSCASENSWFPRDDYPCATKKSFRSPHESGRMWRRPLAF